MKHEWRKKEKNLYIPKQKPELVTVPEQKFFMIKGKETQIVKNFQKR